MLLFFYECLWSDPAILKYRMRRHMGEQKCSETDFLDLVDNLIWHFCFIRAIALFMKVGVTIKKMSVDCR